MCVPPVGMKDLDDLGVADRPWMVLHSEMLIDVVGFGVADRCESGNGHIPRGARHHER
jgi:hypothetical protein